MKSLKLVALLVAIVMLVSVVAACGDKKTDDTTTTAAGTTAAPGTTNAPEATTVAPGTDPAGEDPDDGDPEPETPVTGDDADAFHNQFTVVNVLVDTIETDESFAPWGDGSAAQLFDGADGFFNLDDAETKMGGGTSTIDMTIKFQIEKAKIVGYAFVTGNDSATYKGRTPCVWTIYGCATNSDNDDDWKVIDLVENAGTHNEDHQYFGYSVDSDKQAEYEWIKIVFEGNLTDEEEIGLMGAIQLNEMYLYTK